MDTKGLGLFLPKAESEACETEVHNQCFIQCCESHRVGNRSYNNIVILATVHLIPA